MTVATIDRTTAALWEYQGEKFYGWTRAGMEKAVSRVNQGALLLDARVAANVAFLLEHVEDAPADVGGRGHDFRAPPQLRIADAGQHVAQGIVYRHSFCSLTSST